MLRKISIALALVALVSQSALAAPPSKAQAEKLAYAALRGETPQRVEKRGLVAIPLGASGEYVAVFRAGNKGSFFGDARIFARQNGAIVQLGAALIKDGPAAKQPKKTKQPEKRAPAKLAAAELSTMMERVALQTSAANTSAAVKALQSEVARRGTDGSDASYLLGKAIGRAAADSSLVGIKAELLAGIKGAAEGSKLLALTGRDKKLSKGQRKHVRRLKAQLRRDARSEVLGRINSMSGGVPTFGPEADQQLTLPGHGKTEPQAPSFLATVRNAGVEKKTIPQRETQTLPIFKISTHKGAVGTLVLTNHGPVLSVGGKRFAPQRTVDPNAQPTAKSLHKPWGQMSGKERQLARRIARGQRYRARRSHR
ncbi:MAG: hypothetical protein KC503_19525 [Myxococcales bacterium]|nr:hypothetical protein [Myxococcales bacterium]